MSGVGAQSTRSMTTCARGRPFLNGSGKRSEEQPVAATARTTVETMPIAARTVVMIRHAAPLVYRGAQYRHLLIAHHGPPQVHKLDDDRSSRENNHGCALRQGPRADLRNACQDQKRWSGHTEDH